MNLTLKTEYNMKINKEKTKVLASSRNEETQTQIILDGDPLEQVNEYKYLGSNITEDGHSTKDIISRTYKINCTFQSQKNIFISMKYLHKSEEKSTKSLCLEHSIKLKLNMDHR